jgi:hypothetical protein
MMVLPGARCGTGCPGHHEQAEDVDAELTTEIILGYQPQWSVVIDTGTVYQAIKPTEG